MARRQSVESRTNLQSKLHNLCFQQGVTRSGKEMVLSEDGITLPQTVINMLSRGYKSPVYGRFHSDKFYCEIDYLLQRTDAPRDSVSYYANRYVRKIRKQPVTNMVHSTSKYLKDEGLVAAPFDKGNGIYVLTEDSYQKGLRDILQGAQFEKETGTANELYINEEHKIRKKLLNLRKKGKLSADLYEVLAPTGTKPPRLYGLPKVHKQDVPLRPILSMPGSAYHPIAKKIASWLKHLPEARTNTSTEETAQALAQLKPGVGEKVFSLDVKSLYTNVP